MKLLQAKILFLRAVVSVIGVAAGNFFSAAFEDRCAAVAGASGGIFGLLGLFIADMVLNFETLTRSAKSL